MMRSFIIACLLLCLGLESVLQAGWQGLSAAEYGDDEFIELGHEWTSSGAVYFVRENGKLGLEADLSTNAGTDAVADSVRDYFRRQGVKPEEHQLREGLAPLLILGKVDGYEKRCYILPSPGLQPSMVRLTSFQENHAAEWKYPSFHEQFPEIEEFAGHPILQREILHQQGWSAHISIQLEESPLGAIRRLDQFLRQRGWEDISMSGGLGGMAKEDHTRIASYQKQGVRMFVSVSPGTVIAEKGSYLIMALQGPTD